MSDDDDKDPLATLLACLALEALDSDLFVGDPGPGEGRLFGGMVAAQSALAASRTVPEDRPLHSLHAYFLRPGRHDAPIRFVVQRIRDGKSFTTRNVVAYQSGEAIFNLAASFALPEQGISHQEPAPQAPPPEQCEDWEAVRARVLGDARFEQRSAAEVRIAEPADPSVPAPPRQQIWIRLRGTPPDDPLLHTALLVYMTDRTLASTVARPHGLPWGKRMTASLDHAVWIHRPFRLDARWLLYASESPAAYAARGIIFGGLFLGDTRIASVAQEALIRVRK
jgi:acyl-CoA thioesterase-2